MREVYQEPELSHPDNYLYKIECIRTVKIAYRNPTITPKTLKQMATDDCNARKNILIRQVKERKRPNGYYGRRQ